MKKKAKKMDIKHEDIDAVSVTSHVLYKVDGRKEYTSCGWSVVGNVYAKKTKYILNIVTAARLPLSLYTLGVQGRGVGGGRTKTVFIKPKNKGTIVVYKQKDGSLDVVPVGKGGWFKIPPCSELPKRSEGRCPANPLDVYFLEILGSGERVCSLDVKADRINHRRFAGEQVFSDVEILSGHDNLPPQPGSGGNN